MNRAVYPIAVSNSKAALKAHALQTLSRGPLTRPARSVWNAPDLSDLSALSVRRATAGSWASSAQIVPSNHAQRSRTHMKGRRRVAKQFPVHLL